MKKILIIQGNPIENSYGRQLAEAYARGAAESGAEVRQLVLAEMEFDLNLSGGYKGKQPLEPDLQEAQELIAWADHLVFVYPNWWGGMPALLKGFIDRVFLPGFAFKYRRNSPLPEQLLKGKTARLIVTMDSPYVYYRFYLGQPGHQMMKHSILKFCGVGTVRATNITQLRKMPETARSQWLERVQRMGRKLA
ncbi:NAD(P)H-dependent oxidoreductase [Paenibacillus sp. FSL H8-0457]|uniref:NAD(P)H-dependent oxidoreductase n=1 Tax=Bacillales TaxID=1385 RepID=UPI0003E262AF|nr:MULTISPECIES: NAD(P)H-dependent oxidoreductase [Paenibacillus]ETT69164.1 NAD(P)H dehydrogenase (quinone) [Paenibacillus sp. FSL H8-457]MCM3261382.1 NAD(P)H-dependent oxidoreductase [Paenibacillus lautus]